MGLGFDAVARSHDHARTVGVAGRVDRVVGGWLERVAGAGPGRAIDVGGGAGHDALVLAERGWAVDLVDVSPVMVELARERLASFPDVRCHVGDAVSWLAAEHDPVDLVLALGETLCYLPDSAAAVAEVARSVREGGALLLTYLDAKGLGADAPPAVQERDDPPLWIRAFGRDWLAREVERAGLQVVEEWRHGGRRSALRALR